MNRARLCPACAVIMRASFRVESLQPVQLICATVLQNAGNHPDIWIREARIAPSECPSYNPCTLCMDSAPRASDSPTLCSDPAPPQECRICRMSRPACSILLLLLLMLKLLLLLLLLLLCWLFAWPLGRVGSLHRVSESEALGAESMHRVHRFF